MSQSVSADTLRGGFADIDKLCVNTIRTLAMDAVQKANSGHPGAPMGLAPVAYTLWQAYLRFDPADPGWPGRDRFVLSNGHASMLLYALIHLAGLSDVTDDMKPTGEPALPMEQLQRFRQLDSLTPGHPEHELTAGVETTTGPLGQGVSNAVGMAIAGRWLAARFGRPGFEDLFDFRVYCIAGDGCMMEGIASEASSLAGHLKLPNLCVIYDSNRISIEGSTALAFTEDTAARYKAYGWNVLHVTDANDPAQLCTALDTFQRTVDRPTFIVVNSHIGYGSPHKQDTREAHGEPLGEDEVRATKRVYGWPEDAKFLVPDGVYDRFQAGIARRGKEAHAAWDKKVAEYRTKHPELARDLDHIRDKSLPAGWDKDIPTFPADAKGIASRDSSGKVLNAIAKNVPWLIGGSADLAPSTKTTLTFDGAGVFTAETPGGRNFHFGVREHAMGGVMNGMAVAHVRPYGAGFLIFSDYGRGSIRLAALMHAPVIYIFTHDSIGVGEDGPTHQPVEQLLSLRAIPNLMLIRPADANEVAEAWRVIMPLQHQPAILALSRQALPTIDRTKYAPASGLAKGGYILGDVGGRPDVILIGTGSEVALCVAAHEKLVAEGARSRVVSLPSWDLFDKQPEAYRRQVLPPEVTARVCVEAAAALGWERYAGPTGQTIGMHTFGASAPIKDVMTKFGFTVDNVYAAAKAQLARR
jgi:transketolase